MIANIPWYIITEDDPHLIEMLKKVNDEGWNNLEKIHLYYGNHKAYEDIKNYKSAFKYLKIGNDLLKKETKYNFSQDETGRILLTFYKKQKN